jgi:hypothetical protein
MKNELRPNWFLTHVPAPGSERPYQPMRPVDWGAPGDLCGLGGEQSSDVQLRSIGNASRREQRATERSAR